MVKHLRLCNRESCGKKIPWRAYYSPAQYQRRRFCSRSCARLDQIPSLETRFFAKFKRKNCAGCWLWEGSTNGVGYGQIIENGKKLLAHRVSWTFHVGKLQPSICVLHHCDNPRCVRPGHLFLGTRKDNNNDRIRKGRSKPARGERSGRAKLKAKQIKKIRNLAAQGWSHRRLAKRFDVSHSTIGNILRGKTWTHV